MSNGMRMAVCLVAAAVSATGASVLYGKDGASGEGRAPNWPEVTRNAKPWVYNWWMASAVDERGLENQCAELEAAGFGGFHVIPIYGAKGYEGQWRKLLSPEWVEAWNLAVRTARKHGLGVDLTMTRYRLGRTSDDAAINVVTADGSDENRTLIRDSPDEVDVLHAKASCSWQ